MPYTIISHLLSHILHDYAFTLFLQPNNKVQQKKDNNNHHLLGLLSSPSNLKTSDPGATGVNDMRELVLPIQGLPRCCINSKVAYLLSFSASCRSPGAPVCSVPSHSSFLLSSPALGHPPADKRRHYLAK